MINPHNIELVLKQYGLNGEQIATYLYLVKSGDETPFKISKHTRIPRTTVYRILEELRNLGIVTIFKKNNIAHYTAENPRRLIERLKEKEALISSILPDIDELFRLDKNTPDVKLYTGDNGARVGLDVLYEYLEKHSIKQIYTYSNSEISKHLPKYLNTIIARREKLKIKVNMIAPESAKREVMPHAQHYTINPLREVRFLPNPFIFEGTMIMGGSMAVCFSLKDNQLHTIVLETESIVKMFRQFFLYMWATLEK